MAGPRKNTDLLMHELRDAELRVNAELADPNMPNIVDDIREVFADDLLHVYSEGAKPISDEGNIVDEKYRISTVGRVSRVGWEINEIAVNGNETDKVIRRSLGIVIADYDDEEFWCPITGTEFLHPPEHLPDTVIDDVYGIASDKYAGLVSLASYVNRLSMRTSFRALKALMHQVTPPESLASRVYASNGPSDFVAFFTGKRSNFAVCIVNKKQVFLGLQDRDMNQAMILRPGEFGYDLPEGQD